MLAFELQLEKKGQAFVGLVKASTQGPRRDSWGELQTSKDVTNAVMVRTMTQNTQNCHYKGKICLTNLQTYCPIPTTYLRNKYLPDTDGETEAQNNPGTINRICWE